MKRCVFTQTGHLPLWGHVILVVPHHCIILSLEHLITRGDMTISDLLNIFKMKSELTFLARDISTGTHIEAPRVFRPPSVNGFSQKLSELTRIDIFSLVIWGVHISNIVDQFLMTNLRHPNHLRGYRYIGLAE